MLAARVKLKDAEETRRFLMERGLLDRARLLDKDSEFIYFPISRKFKPPRGCDIVRREFGLNPVKIDWKGLLVERGIIEGKTARELHSAFDGMGDIAVIEIPPEFQKIEGEIGRAFLETHGQFRAVAKKTSAVKGKYRVKGLKVIAGRKGLITFYRESGCIFHIDLGKVYFSPRLGFERERIAKEVGKGEKVLALFAGAGFYPIIIAKRQPKCKIRAIELNPVAVKYMAENIPINKMQDRIEGIGGDVGKLLLEGRFQRWADRITMPLPHDGHKFLDAAIRAAAKNCIIHFYYIPHGDGEDGIVGARKKITDACKAAGRKFKTILERKVKTYAPHVDEVVIDFKLIN
ncbi:MAG: class I SAM-dependent methyltransferase family protein [Candidatus Micrarchaeota archaeon]